MRKKGLFLGFFSLPLFLNFVSAHCPLCTIGAGAAAGGAVYLGVSPAIVALFIGGFSMSMGLWTKNWLNKKYIKKEYFRYQNGLIVLGVFLLTLLPILPVVSVVDGLYVSLFGSYGSIFNRTYLVDWSYVTSLVGAGIVFISPTLSKKLSNKRKGKIIPFQGMTITLGLLLLIGGIFALIL